MTRGWPFASGVPTVSCCDIGAGGLQAGCASGGPCVRFGAAQAAYAGTSDARSGEARRRARVPGAVGSRVGDAPHLVAARRPR